MKINKMEASNFAVAISMLGFGMTAGFAMASLYWETYTNKLEHQLQKSIVLKFQADLKIDELTKDYENLSKRYEIMQKSSDEFVNSLKKINSLAPPDRKIERSRCCTEEECESDFEVPETPTDEQESTD